MTEAEWLRSVKPLVMLRAISRRRSPRKFRLFACAVARAEWREDAASAMDETRLLAVDSMERVADGGSGPIAVSSNRGPFFWPDINGLTSEDAFEAASWAVWNMDDWTPGVSSCSKTDSSFKAVFLRDIFGNPFRPVTFDPEWRTSNVVSLAKSMYESRDFAAMPILSDALQDAGCDHADILDHCRGSGPHVRGCWVVDVALGNA
jgi:hypothetical protein